MSISAFLLIPVYRECPGKDEVRSLVQALKILNSWPVQLFAPENLDMKVYEEIIRPVHNNCRFRFFPGECFSSIESYNHLMLSKSFYESYPEYEYMLLYQLDAWVFKDELEKWCAKGYDYIGAPWISTENGSFRIERFAGNGGFSLRKTASFIKTLETVKLVVKNPQQIISEYLNDRTIPISKIPGILARCCGYKNNSRYFIRSNSKKEDLFWAFTASCINSGFRAAKGTDSISFAFEEYPSKMFELNDGQLPFGFMDGTNMNLNSGIFIFVNDRYTSSISSQLI